MAQKFAGIAFLNAGGQQLALRGNFTVSPSPVERTMIAGQDGVHGYQELPRVPYIEGDISTMPDMRLEDLDGQTDVTVVAQLSNGWQYALIGATCKAALEANARDGQVRVRWEGLWCEEQRLNAPSEPIRRVG
ncbi:MAG TPA: phage tail tube protein [Xanthobacteraceae bacterium]|nr:phage tail tube protein [Xanthobacteraceae bacterium]